jgi:hypothetical protein
VGVQYAPLATLTPIGPSASTWDGNRPVFAICTIFGLYPCCAACCQNVWKSGGIGKVLKISSPFVLNRVICDV